MPVFLKHLQEITFSGVQNFPTVGLMDGLYRANLEATGMGYDKEVAMIAIASVPTIDLAILVALAVAVLQSAAAGRRSFAARLRAPGSG